MKKVSGIITAFNEEDNIYDCIESLFWCDEVLVVDSFSTDKTVSIATKIDDVRVLEREYFGSASQKNWAIDQAKNEWVFILDADERCTPELQSEIESILNKPKYEAYTIRRKTYFLGKEIRFSGWRNDTVVRLLTKTGGRCPNLRAHGGILAYGKAPQLKNPMIHFMVDDIKDYLDRMNKYGYWAASQKYLKGEKSNPMTIFIHTFYRFFKAYIIQLGFLDFGIGFIFCAGQSYGTYVKWTLLWGWNKNHKRMSKPKFPNFDLEEKNWFK